MIIQYKTKEEFGIELIHSVNNISIYKYTSRGCEKYFNLRNDKKYFGYIDDNNNFIIVSVTDETPNEEFKKKIALVITNDILETIKEDLYVKYKLKKELNNIINFVYLINFPSECTSFINLDNAKNELALLNTILKCNNFKITIDYVFQMKDIHEIASYSLNSTTLLLCIIDENTNNCVASLVIDYNTYNSNEISFNSETKSEYKGNKLNKLLRAVLIIISKKLYPSARNVLSLAVNPISAYLMIKYFNANHDGKTPLDVTFNGLMEYFKTNSVGLTCIVELNDANIKNARDVFEKISKDEIECEKETLLSQGRGGKKRSRKSKKKRKTIKKKRKTKTRK